MSMTVEGAVRVVARRVIADLAADVCGEMWELYPDIGENDWNRVCDEVEEIISANIRGPDEEFDIAYTALRRRASP